MHMKMFSQMHMNRLFEREKYSPPSPPAHKKKR
jgi:hypothetical protein